MPKPQAALESAATPPVGVGSVPVPAARVSCAVAVLGCQMQGSLTPPTNLSILLGKSPKPLHEHGLLTVLTGNIPKN